MSNFQLQFLAFGQRGIYIEWPRLINSDILNNRVAFEKIIREKAEKKFTNQIEDIIPAYHSITLIFSQALKNFTQKVKFLNELYTELETLSSPERRLFHIPVYYQDSSVDDVVNLSERLNLSVNEIIKIHTQTAYTIHFIGFLPGFLYLGGLDSRLHIPRKSVPSLAIPKGSVAIGGEQTGIYPQESPGGWYVVGTTPVEFFNASADSPCFAYANDQIKFFSIDRDEYDLIKNQIEEQSYQIKIETINA